MDFDSPFAETLSCADVDRLSMEAWAMTTGSSTMGLSSSSPIIATTGSGSGSDSNDNASSDVSQKGDSKPLSHNNNVNVPEAARQKPSDEPFEVCDICERVFKGAKRSTHKQQHTRRLHPQFYVPKRGGKKRSVGPTDQALNAAAAAAVSSTNSGKDASKVNRTASNLGTDVPSTDKNEEAIRLFASNSTNQNSTNSTANNSNYKVVENTNSTTTVTATTNASQPLNKKQNNIISTTITATPISVPSTAAPTSTSAPLSTINATNGQGSADKTRRTDSPASSARDSSSLSNKEQPTNSMNINIAADGFIPVTEASTYLEQMANTNYKNKQLQLMQKLQNSQNPSPPPAPTVKKPKNLEPVELKYSSEDLCVMTLKKNLKPEFELDKEQEQVLKRLFSVEVEGSVEHYFKHELSAMMQYGLTSRRISVSTLKIAIQGSIHYLTTLKAPINEDAFWEKFLIDFEEEDQEKFDADFDDQLLYALHQDIEDMCMRAETKQSRQVLLPVVTTQDTFSNGRPRKRPTEVVSFGIKEDKPWERY